MKSRFILFRRAGVFYCEDTTTRKQTSLRTKDEAEAVAPAQRQKRSLPPARPECPNRPRLPDGDRSSDRPADMGKRHGADADARQGFDHEARCARAMQSKAFDGLRRVKLIETTAEDFLTILNGGKVSVAHYLKRLHNLALSLGWLSVPVLAPACGRSPSSSPSGESPWPNISASSPPRKTPSAAFSTSCCGKSARRKATPPRSPPRISTGRRAA